MRDEVRAQSAPRLRILTRHPAPATDLDVPLSAAAARAVAEVEARLAALDPRVPVLRAAAPAPDARYVTPVGAREHLDKVAEWLGIDENQLR